MTINTSIKTFIRLDDMMMSTVFPAVDYGYHVKDHWILWVIPHTQMTREIEEWLAHQPSSAYKKADVRIYCDEIVEREDGDHTVLGVSLSTASREILEALHDAKKCMPIVKAYLVGDYRPTKNPLLYIGSRPDVLCLKRHASDRAESNIPFPSTNPELIQKFKESLKGHDFWYVYSDSLEVWRNGEAKTKRLKDAGIAMGLKPDEVDKLYSEVYGELSKR